MINPKETTDKNNWNQTACLNKLSSQLCNKNRKYTTPKKRCSLGYFHLGQVFAVLKWNNQKTLLITKPKNILWRTQLMLYVFFEYQYILLTVELYLKKAEKDFHTCSLTFLMTRLNNSDVTNISSINRLVTSWIYLLMLSTITNIK